MTKLRKTIVPESQDDGIYDDDGFESEMAEAGNMIADNPNDATGYVKRGRLHADDSSYEEAMPDLDNAICLDPDNAEAHAARGFVYGSYSFDDGDQAHRDFDMAMTILARQHPVRLQRRDSDAKSPSELAQVIAAAKKDIRNKHNPYAALIRRARAYHDLADSKKMKKDLAKAIEREPQQAEAYLVRAELWITENDDKRVKADIEEAYRLDPTRPEGFTALAKLYYHAGEGPNNLALEAADKALAICFYYAPAHYLRGQILRVLGQLPEAIKAFREAVAFDPHHAFAHTCLAECLEEGGLIPEAIAEYEKFVATADKVYALEIIDTIKHVEELKNAKQS